MEFLYANDTQVQYVLENLSDDEIEAAWPAIEQLDGVLELEDRPLMAWALVKPETGSAARLYIRVSVLSKCHNT